MTTRRKFWTTGEIFLLALAFFFFSPQKVFASYSLSVNNFPQSIDADNQQEIDLEVTAKLGGGSEYYLRAAFSYPDNPSAYFGYTNGYNGTEAKSFYKITTDGNGGWNGVLKVKPDIGSQYFKGEGTYNFKIGYYTAAGSGPTWKYENTVLLTYTSPTPTSTLTLTPTPTPTETLPTLTPTPTCGLIATPTLSQILNENEDGLAKIMGDKAEEVVLGEQDSSTRAATVIPGKDKIKITAAIFIIGGLALLGLAGFFLFKEKYKKDNLLS